MRTSSFNEWQMRELERAMIDAHTFRARQMAEEQRRRNPPKPQNEWTPEEVANVVELQNAKWLHGFLLPADWEPIQGIDALLRHPDTPPAARERHQEMRG